jgi:hypothetical protein
MGGVAVQITDRFAKATRGNFQTGQIENFSQAEVLFQKNTKLG